MNNEPVAVRYDFDGYGYQYMDSGSGSDWLTRVDGELLYTCPSEHEELKATVRSFFQDFLDIREESDSGRVFAPITISSCRCMMTEPLAEVLAKMRKLSGSEK